jgi:PE-PPE domain/PE family
MTSVLTDPQVMATAAADVAGLGSAINETTAAAAGPTTRVVAAAADEVSAATATLFSTYAQEHQAVINQALVFHGEFAQALAAAGNAYAEAEAAASGALGALTAPAQTLLAPLTGSTATGAEGAPAAKAVDVALILAASGTPTPPQNYIDGVYSKFIAPDFSAGTVQGLSLPNGLYPLTGVKDLTVNISLARGVTILNNAILQQFQAGNTVVVSGYSQSSVVASMVMPQLVAEGVPDTAVNFVLLADPSTPNGGLFSRFPGLSFPSLGVTLGNATPGDDYPTVIYNVEYDGFADFPRYPIDIFSDLNALLGMNYAHELTPTLNPADLPSGYSITQLPTQGPTETTYYMINNPNLPLLQPVRSIPYIGNPIADALQGPLTPLVNWGYGDPAYGYSTGPANVPTPFGFLPPLSDTAALGPAMVSGTQQGISAAMSAFHAEGPPSLPAISLPSISQALTSHLSVPSSPAMPTPTSAALAIDNFILSLEAANNNVVGGFANGFSAAYATLLPTADIATALAVSLPSYDLNLFLHGITQAVNGQPLAGLVNAIGDPIAADVAAGTLLGGFELLVIKNALDTILTGTPYPGLGNTYPLVQP